MKTLNANPNMNTNTARCLQANETSQHFMTCHVRHIFTPDDETIKNNLPYDNIIPFTISILRVKLPDFHLVSGD